MSKIENDILEDVQLEGITQNELDNMSNYELKEFQRGQSDEKIQKEKKNLEFAIVSTLFFLAVAVMLYINPIFTVYAAIAPAVLTIAFLIRTNYCHENLKMERTSRAMLESFYEGNDL